MKIVEKAETKNKKKNFNRNRKKNWRHKIKLDDIEDALDAKRREEVHGGILGERPFDDLFILDSNDKAVQPQKKVISLPKKDLKSKPPGQSSFDLKIRNKQPTNQVLKCQEFLSGLPGVKPISQEGNLMKQRVPRTLAYAIKAGKNTQKGKLLRKTLKMKREKDLAKKKLMQTSMVFNKDLWQSNKESKELEQKFGKWGKSYLEQAVKYYKVTRGLSEIKRPIIQFTKPSRLRVNNNPHPGISYNPSLKDHKNVIEEAMIEEEQKEKKKLKKRRLVEESIQYAEKAPSKWEKEAELLSGLPEEMLGKPTEPKEPSDEEDELTCVAHPKPPRKTKKARLKTLRAILNKRLERRNKARKLIADGLNNLDKLVKEVKTEEWKTERKRLRAQRQKKKAKFNTKRLGPLEFRKDSVCVPTLKHLTGSVRTIEPIGSHIATNVNNKQERNLIAPEKLPRWHSRRMKVIPRSGKGEAMSKFVKELNIQIYFFFTCKIFVDLLTSRLKLINLPVREHKQLNNQL